jgi:hypothetical protein
MSSFSPRARKPSYSARTFWRMAWSSALGRSAIRFMGALGIPGAVYRETGATVTGFLRASGMRRRQWHLAWPPSVNH